MVFIQETGVRALTWASLVYFWKKQIFLPKYTKLEQFSCPASFNIKRWEQDVKGLL